MALTSGLRRHVHAIIVPCLIFTKTTHFSYFRNSCCFKVCFLCSSNRRTTFARLSDFTSVCTCVSVAREQAALSATIRESNAPNCLLLSHRSVDEVRVAALQAQRHSGCRDEEGMREDGGRGTCPSKTSSEKYFPVSLRCRKINRLRQSLRRH